MGFSRDNPHVPFRTRYELLTQGNPGRPTRSVGQSSDRLVKVAVLGMLLLVFIGCSEAATAKPSLDLPAATSSAATAKPSLDLPAATSSAATAKPSLDLPAATSSAATAIPSEECPFGLTRADVDNFRQVYRRISDVRSKFGRTINDMHRRISDTTSFSGQEEERFATVAAEAHIGAQSLREYASEVFQIKHIPYPPYPTILRIHPNIQDIETLLEEIASSIEAGDFSTTALYVDQIDDRFDSLDRSLIEVTKNCK